MYNREGPLKMLEIIFDKMVEWYLELDMFIS